LLTVNKKRRMINKWTLKIKDNDIQKDFQKYVMDGMMSKVPYVIGF